MMLEFDSVRPPRHESNFPSFFQVRARGLELETVSTVFALEQLTGPDPSSAPGMLYLIPRETLHPKHTQDGESKNSRVADPPCKTVDYDTHSKLFVFESPPNSSTRLETRGLLTWARPPGPHYWPTGCHQFKAHWTAHQGTQILGSLRPGTDLLEYGSNPLRTGIVTLLGHDPETQPPI